RISALRLVSLHDALPISWLSRGTFVVARGVAHKKSRTPSDGQPKNRLLSARRRLSQTTRTETRISCRYVSETAARSRGTLRYLLDRKSTRLNSSHEWISY